MMSQLIPLAPFLPTTNALYFLVKIISEASYEIARVNEKIVS